ncbi:DUF2399 domain-containing protein [Companilactobacillus baiquanensis]|uniref:DUF2399 domain-containing protein n=1 Tax=Companilactobacillus baiquanensis TaxID=2486005 RepID=A0ABW1UXZ4_9LACO|nr:DUF2399 domain-containing protein [Companilactobacillus baiquanensis]
MSRYTKVYEKETKKRLPKDAGKLDVLFDKISSDEPLPPRGQQAVDLGFTAHTLNDAKENPVIYAYYKWILKYFFNDKPINELTANLIGTSFVSANIFQSNLPQPLTLNPWQIEQMTDISIMNKKAVIIENNGVFIWLHKKHPTWPLINQSGNNFNESYNKMLENLVKRNLKMAYLGDLDSEGIRIANRIIATIGEDAFMIQSPNQVFEWLIKYGKNCSERTKRLEVENKILLEEMDSICTLQKFVEQEQLIDEYEVLIWKWLGDEI